MGCGDQALNASGLCGEMTELPPATTASRTTYRIVAGSTSWFRQNDVEWRGKQPSGPVECQRERLAGVLRGDI